MKTTEVYEKHLPVAWVSGMKTGGLARFMRLARCEPGGRATIRARHIYILPTGYGLSFGVLLLLILLGSINYANNLGFLLSFLLTGLGVVTMIHTWRNLLGLELQAARARPVFAGQDASFEILLVNRRNWGRPGIQLQLQGSPPAAADLSDQGSERVIISMATTHRGRVPLERLTLSTNYPLGLLRAWVFVQLHADCLVYPAPGAVMPRSEMSQYTRSQQGDKGVGADDFVGLRHYRPGDSPKHVNWKAVAREQELQTKLFGGDRAERRWLDWNGVTGGCEERLRRLCRGVVDCCEQQLEFGLRLPGLEIKPARGQLHRHDCLAALALFGE